MAKLRKIDWRIVLYLVCVAFQRYLHLTRARNEEKWRKNEIAHFLFPLRTFTLIIILVRISATLPHICYEDHIQSHYHRRMRGQI